MTDKKKRGLFSWLGFGEDEGKSQEGENKQIEELQPEKQEENATIETELASNESEDIIADASQANDIPSVNTDGLDDEINTTIDFESGDEACVESVIDTTVQVESTEESASVENCRSACRKVIQRKSLLNKRNQQKVSFQG